MRMNTLHVCVSFVLMFMCFCTTVFCTDTDKCYLNSKTKNIEEEKLLNRISPLFGQIFRTDKNGFSYVVAICSDTSKPHGNPSSSNASITRTRIKDDTLVLGRRNDTHLDGGDTWVMLRYGSGDKRVNDSNQCLVSHSASIYIVCDPERHDESPKIKLTESDGCNYRFVLPISSICEHEEKVSGGTVVFIVFCIVFFMYFIVGIIYRRLARNAQGCQQLPHFDFWQRIGALLSDGCNYLCRCDGEPEDSWNITSNFDSGDRDDTLLKP